MSERGTIPGADGDAFAELVGGHLDDVFRYLAYLTGDRSLAEDLAADTFERAFRERRRFDPRRAGPRGWLLSIARSTALDHLRAERRRRAREHAYAQPADAADAPGFCDGYSASLEAALRSLSAADREVVALRVLLDLDAAAAARLLGITPTACSTRLSRALGRLAQELETHELADRT
jgi:RNA polymerase sigma-70 factor, ECF subfamily